MYPRYRYPRKLFFELAWAALFKRRRDFRADARRCIAALEPPLRVQGAENIPERGPCLLVMNHYSRPGFRVWWLSLVLSSLLPMPHAWMVASEWTAPGKWYEPAKELYSGSVSQRLAYVYDFLRMPPMPPRPQDVARRAASVRAVLAYVERRPEPVLCLAPEGYDIPEGKLGWPPEGVGRFISLLAACGLPILPVGGFEEEGALTVRFGPAYALGPSRERNARARDRLAAERVMRSIACLLPEALRGDFA